MKKIATNFKFCNLSSKFLTFLISINYRDLFFLIFGSETDTRLPFNFGTPEWKGGGGWVHQDPPWEGVG